jgi:hypothetical protein
MIAVLIVIVVVTVLLLARPPAEREVMPAPMRIGAR